MLLTKSFSNKFVQLFKGLSLNFLCLKFNYTITSLTVVQQEKRTYSTAAGHKQTCIKQTVVYIINKYIIIVNLVRSCMPTMFSRQTV